MNKHALALVVPAAVAGAAAAQNSVTVYGKVDLGVGTAIGSDAKQLFDAGGTNISRLGFRGTEDLGGGYAAFFGMEHRFRPDTGADATIGAALPGGRFWHGYSIVGLLSPFGSVTLGRQYTPSFSLVQNQIDPWTGETVAALRPVGMLAGPGFASVRFADSIRYDHAIGSFKFGAAIAEGDNADAPGPDRPWSAAASYDAAPLYLSIAFENKAGANDRLWNAGARYRVGPATLSAGYSRGRTNADTDVKGWLLGALVALGVGELKVGYARTDSAGGAASGVRDARKVGIGYHYHLSKRTKLYADAARDRKAPVSKNGYDLGIQHNF